MSTIDDPHEAGNGGCSRTFLCAWAPHREAVMTKMIEALNAAVEAEKVKLLAELSQAAEPRLSAIRREIAACDSLLARLNRSRAA